MGLGASLRSRRFVSLFSTVFFPSALGIGLVHGGQFMAAFACCLPPFFGIAVDRFVSSSRSSTLLPPLGIYIDGIVDVGVLVNIRFLPETVLWVAGLVTLSRSTSSASSVSRRDVEPTFGRPSSSLATRRAHLPVFDKTLRLAESEDLIS